MIPAIGIAAGLAAIAKTMGAIAVAKLADRVVMFLALKALLTTLFIIVMPVVLKNLVFEVVEIGMNLVDSHAQDLGDTGILVQQFTGLTGWLVQVFRIPECISIMVTAFQVHLFLRIIPFSPVR